jgi:hypothetical protein
MKLALDPVDLKPKFQVNRGTFDVPALHPTVNASEVTFDHLCGSAQRAVLAVGRATYYSWDRETYNAIYPPKD